MDLHELFCNAQGFHAEVLPQVRLLKTKEEGLRAQDDMSMSVGSAGLEGFALSIGLILALGPQNAFVLRQGLLRSHVLATCLVCSLADASLIAAGVIGVGSFLSEIEGAEFLIALGAAVFLIGYGLLRIRSSIDPVGIAIEGGGESGLVPTVGAALAFTFLIRTFMSIHCCLSGVLRADISGTRGWRSASALPRHHSFSSSRSATGRRVSRGS